MDNKQMPWYHGQMSPEKAAKICTRIGRNGAFLIRESQSVSGAFTLSLYFDNEVYHHRIKMTAENKFIFEATKQEFASLQEIVNYFMEPRESMIYPLAIAVFPSLVTQLDSNDHGWDQNMTASSPLYQQVPFNNNSPKQVSHTTPFPVPSVPCVHDESHLKDDTCDVSTVQQNTASAGQEEEWPAPPDFVLTELSLPKPKPKVSPKPIKTNRGSKNRAQSMYIMNSSENTSFASEISSMQRRQTMQGGLSGQEIKNSKNPADRDSRNRAQSMYIMNSSENTSSGIYSDAHTVKNVQREISSMQRRQTMQGGLSGQEIKNSKNPADHKKSPFQAFASLFRKKKWKQTQIKDSKDEKSGKEAERVSSNKEDDDEEQVYYIPIICKTKFVAIDDHFGQVGAMEFKKGTEMVIKGMRVDGWWYCINSETKEQHWVFKDHLKPKSDTQWFEAKPVETSDDERAYEKFDDEFDDDADETYCRYLIPVDDLNTPL